MLDATSAVIFDNVSVTAGGVRILENVSAAVPRGSATAIIGPNGAGKTTLLLSLLGQMQHEGRIRLTAAGDRPARLGYVPQRLDFDRGMPMTVLEMLAMGSQRMPLWFGIRRRAREAALTLLSQVKADHLARRRVGALSGGELQRVLLALAIQQQPDVLILDEPSSGVDIGGGSLLCELLDTLRAAQGFTQIMVTHDLSMVTAHANHVICLNRRLLGQGPTATTLTADVLAATFGIHLGLANLHAMPQIPGQACTCPEHRHDEAEPRSTGVSPVSRMGVSPMQTQPGDQTPTSQPHANETHTPCDGHGQDARGTHGRDARATRGSHD
ncbi:MAG: metal ABC transporter ATP-binding protein [Phycisphaerae bacterium]|nr:metal ABC transporter ATP-binding protein [Phycisphaerae bacterium]